MRKNIWTGLAYTSTVSLFVCALASSRSSTQKSGHAFPERDMVHYRNTNASVVYVGSGACQQCHPEIYKEFKLTEMGRSMSVPEEQNAVQAVHGAITVQQPNSNTYYQVYRKGTDFFQSQFQLDKDGKVVFRKDYKIDWIIGAGANGFGGIVRRGKFLFEAPLSYYTQANIWNLSPGYEFAEYGFNRSIPEDCIVCHSGQPQLTRIVDGEYKVPPFKGLAIGCENCHGPGGLHVTERQMGVPLNADVDSSIVNPAKLPGWLADNLCMSCHQGADVRALMPGKKFTDFRPGTPLSQIFAIFAVPFRRDNPPRDPLLQQFVQMSLSECYFKSGGQLHCISCHDPHIEPLAKEAPAFFREKCLKCHTTKSCTLPQKARVETTPPDNCIECHMPKRNLRDISHSSLTNHRIPARPNEPFPERAFSMTTPGLPDLIYLNAAPGTKQKPVPTLTLFRAYGQLMGTHPEYRQKYESTLDDLAKEKIQNPSVFSALGQRELEEHTIQAGGEAARYFAQAIQAGSTNPYDFELLATLQAKAGKVQDAIATVQHGLDLNPYSPRLYRVLTSFYVSIENYDAAMIILKKELELYPEDSNTRKIIEEIEQPSK
jgi:hypothetical protein